MRALLLMAAAVALPLAPAAKVEYNRPYIKTRDAAALNIDSFPQCVKGCIDMAWTQDGCADVACHCQTANYQKTLDWVKQCAYAVSGCPLKEVDRFVAAFADTCKSGGGKPADANSSPSPDSKAPDDKPPPSTTAPPPPPPSTTGPVTKAFEPLDDGHKEPGDDAGKSKCETKTVSGTTACVCDGKTRFVVGAQTAAPYPYQNVDPLYSITLTTASAPVEQQGAVRAKAKGRGRPAPHPVLPPQRTSTRPGKRAVAATPPAAAVPTHSECEAYYASTTATPAPAAANKAVAAPASSARAASALTQSPPSSSATPKAHHPAKAHPAPAAAAILVGNTTTSAPATAPGNGTRPKPLHHHHPHANCSCTGTAARTPQQAIPSTVVVPVTSTVLSTRAAAAANNAVPVSSLAVTTRTTTVLRTTVVAPAPSPAPANQAAAVAAAGGVTPVPLIASSALSSARAAAGAAESTTVVISVLTTVYHATPVASLASASRHPTHAPNGTVPFTSARPSAPVATSDGSHSVADMGLFVAACLIAVAFLNHDPGLFVVSTGLALVFGARRILSFILGIVELCLLLWVLWAVASLFAGWLLFASGAGGVLCRERFVTPQGIELCRTFGGRWVLSGSWGSMSF